MTNIRLVTITNILFLIPYLILGLSFHSFAAFCGTLGALYAAYVIARNPPQNFIHAKDNVKLISSFVLSFLLVILSGQGHLLYTNWDWLVRDAVLHDVSIHPLPLIYEHNGSSYLLRMPLGFYLIPSLFGRLFGIFAAQLAMLSQVTFMLGSVIYFTSSLLGRNFLIYIMTFVLFSGLDSLGILLKYLTGTPFDWAAMHGHLEWWAGKFQYSSFITLLFWVPNYALPGWWFGVISIMASRGIISTNVIISLIPALTLWSPLSMIGALPFALYLALKNLSPRLIIDSVAIFAGSLPLIGYLSSDPQAVPRELLINDNDFLKTYLLFISLELPQLFILIRSREFLRHSDRILLYLSGIMLLFIPIYKVGIGNDFAMRASIVPLFYISAYFSCILSDAGFTLYPRLKITAWIVVIIASITPFTEIMRAFSGSYKFSDCDFVSAVEKIPTTTFPSTYMARVENTPKWIIGAQSKSIISSEKATCWPDHPFADMRK